MGFSIPKNHPAIGDPPLAMETLGGVSPSEVVDMQPAEVICAIKVRFGKLIRTPLNCVRVGFHWQTRGAFHDITPKYHGFWYGKSHLELDDN